MKQTFSCIIPFYNEGEQLLRVLETVSDVPSIDQIILVDDGSTNTTSNVVVNKFKNTELIKLSQNHGKSAAVRIGLEKTKNECIVMLDADFLNLDPKEIEKVLVQYKKANLDMLLVQIKGGNNWFDRLLRKEVLFSGFRVLKKSDLEEVFKSNPHGYQLEVTINEHMIQHNKRVAWLPSNIHNVHKSQKWGVINGFKKSIQMEISIFCCLGTKKYLRQVFSFATEKLE